MSLLRMARKAKLEQPDSDARRARAHGRSAACLDGLDV